MKDYVYVFLAMSLLIFAPLSQFDMPPIVYDILTNPIISFIVVLVLTFKTTRDLIVSVLTSLIYVCFVVSLDLNKVSEEFKSC